MSVTDPLIKEIKGCCSRFLEENAKTGCISDSNGDLFLFCHTIEKVFILGLLPQQNSFGFWKDIEPWTWMEKLGNIHGGIVTFAYTNAVEKVRQCCTTQRNVGRFRLLVRHCLVSRCLHVPLEYLIYMKTNNILYKENSIVGDEILSQILLSVLLQCSKITFKLDVQNSSFLDITWRIPEILKLEFVPCDNLGISVSFTGEKAVIVHLKPHSVISEYGNVEIGDILDNLNGIHICAATKGRLSAIFQNKRKQPITVTIIKAINSTTNEMFPPIAKLVKDVNLDPAILKDRYFAKKEGKTSSVKSKQNKSAGFKVTYLGSVHVGKQGDVKQIDKSVKLLLSPYRDLVQNSSLKAEKQKQSVFFEIGEIGVKIVDYETSELALKHSYMEISSCASVSNMPNYFAYVAGDENCTTATNFVCYLFHSKSAQNAYTILQSIGQGFHRTHFAV